MAFTRQDKDGHALLKIEGPISLYEITPLHEELMVCLDRYEDLTLEVDGVTDCDTAGIQLLCSARKTAALAGKAFVVTGASGPVLEAVFMGGLNSEELLDAGKEVSNG